MKNNIRNLWNRVYSYIIPSAGLIGYIILFLNGVDLSKSNNFTDALNSVITFVSIVIGLFGVLLTILISAKESSSMVEYFLKSVKQSYFINSLKKNIISGLCTIILSCVLYFYDIGNNFYVFVLFVEIWALLYFAVSSYRFINLLLKLLLTDKKPSKKEKYNSFDTNQKEDLDEKLRNMNASEKE